MAAELSGDSPKASCTGAALWQCMDDPGQPGSYGMVCEEVSHEGLCVISLVQFMPVRALPPTLHMDDILKLIGKWETATPSAPACANWRRLCRDS
jgi:hypothetical protein